MRALYKYSTPSCPKCFIHTSGTGILITDDVATGAYGTQNDKVFDDWEGIKEITSLPDHALHRKVDKIVLDASESAPDYIKTAIVCPPAIYGLGRGPGNRKRSQIYFLARTLLKAGKGARIGEGRNIWSAVHVQDLSRLFLLLGEAGTSMDAPATWRAEGYYFAENGEFLWGDVLKEMARIAFEKKLITSPELVEIPSTGSEETPAFFLHMWGTNSRSRAVRARRLLDWRPQMPDLWDVLPEIVEGEEKVLSML